VTRKELERMVQALMDRSLGKEDCERLQAELRTNAESRAFFRRSMEIEVLLAETLRNSVAGSVARHGMERLLRQRRGKQLARTLFATAALLMIAAVVMALVIIGRPQPPALTGTPVPGTQWQVQGKNPSKDGEGHQVEEGSTVTVISGTVRMELESGLLMLVRGPAEVSFPKLNRPVLSHGWLWIDSGTSQDAVEVETPGLRVRDIGTRFGVRVREDELTEVHLVEGLLEIESKRRKQAAVKLKPAAKGHLFPEVGPSTEILLADDPFPALPALIATTPGYRTTVLSQGPVGYWRLDDEVGKDLANEVPKGVAGWRGNGVSPGKPGIDSSENWHGFPANNRSLYMTGDPLTSVLIGLDVPGGVSREEGGLSFWIRRDAENLREEILWLAGGSTSDSALNPRESIMHTRLSEGGRLEFVIENGEFDVVLSSNFSVADGRWHHISASWGPTAVELHVDGRRVERVDDFGSLQQGVIRGRYVRFGKPSSDLTQSGNQPFIGWVDELAVWNRPLSPQEVAHQFRSAGARDDGH
jgi:hypothetical protein